MPIFIRKRGMASGRKGGIDKMMLFIIGLLLCFSTVIFFIYSPRNSNVTYGVTLSKPFAEYMGLDWKANYIALLDNLKVKRFRIPIYWTEDESAAVP